MQEDGNFVLYDETGRARWATGTTAFSGCHAQFDADGNIGIYDRSFHRLWVSSVTSGHPGFRLAVQEDGNMVIYAADSWTPIWSTGNH